ncbi:MAG: C39 family peptidase [bacterium]|nr:C39 family peptidase [bacterium]
MYLQVPYVRQPRNSNWCAAACTAMVLRWHGLRITQERIAREIPITQGGTQVTRLAQYFTRKGFDTTLQFWLPGFESGFMGIKGSGDVPQVMEVLEWGARCGHSLTNRFSREVRAFVRRGGKIDLKTPDFLSIEEEIRNQRPVILPVHWNLVWGIERPQDRHFVVVIGSTDLDSQLTREYFYVNDPYRHKEKFISSDVLLDAVRPYLNCAIYIQPRK